VHPKLLNHSPSLKKLKNKMNVANAKSKWLLLNHNDNIYSNGIIFSLMMKKKYQYI